MMSWDLNIAKYSTASQFKWYTMFVMFKAWPDPKGYQGHFSQTKVLMLLPFCGFFKSLLSVTKNHRIDWVQRCLKSHLIPTPLSWAETSHKSRLMGVVPHSAKTCHKKWFLYGSLSFPQRSLYYMGIIRATPLIRIYCESSA